VADFYAFGCAFAAQNDLAEISKSSLSTPDQLSHHNLLKA